MRFGADQELAQQSQNNKFGLYYIFGLNYSSLLSSFLFCLRFFFFPKYVSQWWCLQSQSAHLQHFFRCSKDNLTDDRLEHEEPGLKKTVVCTHDWSTTGRDALNVHMKVV